jgi:hypothetical protein
MNRTARTLLSIALLAAAGCADTDKVQRGPLPGLEALGGPEADGPGLRRRIGVAGVRDSVGGRADIADAVSSLLVAELSRPRLSIVGPERLEALIADRRGGVGGGVEGAPLTSAEAADLGRRTSTELMLCCSLIRCDIQERQSTFNLPLPGIPIPAPVPIPGIGIPINSRRVRVQVGLEGRLVDTATGRTVWVGRGWAVKEGKTGSLFSRGTMESMDSSIPAAAVRDLLTRMFPNLLRHPWTALVSQVDHRGVFVNSGKSAGLALGDRLLLYRAAGMDRIDADNGLPVEADDLVGHLEIVRLGEGHAVARLVDGGPAQPGDFVRPDKAPRTPAPPPPPAKPSGPSGSAGSPVEHPADHPGDRR